MKRYKLEDFKPVGEDWRYDETCMRGSQTYESNLTISVNLLEKERKERLPEELRKAAEDKLNMLLEEEPITADKARLMVYLCWLCTERVPADRAMWIEIAVESMEIENPDHYLETGIDIDEDDPMYGVCKAFVRTEIGRILFG